MAFNELLDRHKREEEESKISLEKYWERLKWNDDWTSSIDYRVVWSPLWTTTTDITTNTFRF